MPPESETHRRSRGKVTDPYHLLREQRHHQGGLESARPVIAQQTPRSVGDLGASSEGLSFCHVVTASAICNALPVERWECHGMA